MMSRNIKMATEVKTWLQERGSHVNESWLGVARPVLEITCPPPELVRNAVRIMEHKSGVARSVWTARLNGCQIIWR
ncbi:hypothetical protein KV337_005101 [Escherichia coli]|jgi:hypothetical protein|nr:MULTISPECIES: hypothetical protein [Enterobacteriaceae]EHU3723617.1 hypothetical protein [Salmonella enterica]EJP4068275.1 hypothetical protein [Salmonella enterica subsp. enterica serovar Newport]DAG59409.1 MAG TPA: hypothetical protein [Bacteriophage sp.]HBN3105434.1 hypothetical protein [Escherichia coli O25b:H4-ST131]HDQ6536120.1 hypothetical protein [Escherichia coli O36:H14]HDQ6568154.1 hypothetical protein [Escherichia coli Ou:H7]HDQ6731307.1 hypothetical protein [Escherichia coli 